MILARRLAAGLAIAVASIGAILTGCASDPSRGYSFASSYDARLDSVEVRLFDNLSFTHGVEVFLTDAIVKEIQTSTPWDVRGSGNARTTLSGVITDVQLRPLGIARETGLVQEMGVRITVDYLWRDNRSGEVLLARQGVSSLESFVPALGVGERIEIGENAAIDEMARNIVASMRTGW